MKLTAIAPLIIYAFLLGSMLTACNQASNPNMPTSPAPVASTPSQANSSPASTPADTPQANSSTKTEGDPQREQRREARRKQIEAVLTPDQVQQLQAKLKQGDKLRSAISSLNLTTEQKAKIQIIMEKSYEQTPDASANTSPQ
jgi:hypothetical protein